MRVTDDMIETGARVLWDSRDARHGGSWDSRGANEVIVAHTKATARAMLRAALAEVSEPGETWAGWLGRRTADALFFWLCLWLAHWMGVVVFVNCGGGHG